MRLLYVEDSARLRKYIAKGLEHAGFAVDVAADGEEGLWRATEQEYDVVILDVMLPRLDGFELLKRLRADGRTTHVLLLTAKDTVDDRVHGLQLGADDYLVKPFAFEELLARVQALVRRKYGKKSALLTVGDVSVDTLRRQAFRRGEGLDLRPREYALLEFLAFRKGEVVSRAEIEQHIYDDLAEPMSNVVNAAVSILRKKIDPPAGPSYIATRRGLGYVLQEPDPSDRFAQS
jgi:DNA-binding response OmpR family regulator